MTSKFNNVNKKNQKKQQDENDMTLNDKINKVISDIKRLND